MPLNSEQMLPLGNPPLLHEMIISIMWSHGEFAHSENDTDINKGKTKNLKLINTVTLVRAHN